MHPLKAVINIHNKYIIIELANQIIKENLLNMVINYKIVIHRPYDKW